jgi:hypothetical protein
MRYLARIALLGVAVSLGCGTTGTSTITPIFAPGQPAPWSGPLKVTFDDISVTPKPVVPIRLTASDGSGLALVNLQARAVVDDPLAFTELHLTFENTENRVREGTFSIVLPQGASISRFAMRIGGGLQEGEVVERKKARETYEDFLHRKQDPALLEQNAGNEFSARVFPIPARGRKELVVSYSQEITSATPYVLPLKGMPDIESLNIEAYLAGRAAPMQTLSQQHAVPTADFRLDSKLFAERGGLRSGNLVAARVKPVVASRPEPLKGALILVDTSASRALGLAEEARVVARLCAAIAKATGDEGQVVVAAYDQSVEGLYEGAASGFGDGAIGRMRQRMALGASNLDAALWWAGERAKAKGLSRMILITDGIPTAGATGGDRLRARARSLKAAGIERLDAIGVGGIRDDDLLRSLVRSGLAKAGVVIDSGAGEEEIVRRLSEATVSGVEVKVENANFVFPTMLDGLQAGDEALVYANVPDGKAVRISVGGAGWVTPALARVERPLLERAWVGAKIKSLLETERTRGPSEALSREIVGCRRSSGCCRRRAPCSCWRRNGIISASPLIVGRSRTCSSRTPGRCHCFGGARRLPQRPSLLRSSRRRSGRWRSRPRRKSAMPWQSRPAHRTASMRQSRRPEGAGHERRALPMHWRAQCAMPSPGQTRRPLPPTTSAPSRRPAGAGRPPPTSRRAQCARPSAVNNPRPRPRGAMARASGTTRCPPAAIGGTTTGAGQPAAAATWGRAGSLREAAVAPRSSVALTSAAIRITTVPSLPAV